MILLKCPLCDNMMAAEVDAVKVGMTVFCPHCHKESDVNDVLNRKLKAGSAQLLFDELIRLSNEIECVNIRTELIRLHEKYHVAIAVLAYILNCLLDNLPEHRDYPPMFVEYKDPQGVDMSEYLKLLKHEIDQKHDEEPEISIMAHCMGSRESAYQLEIRDLKQAMEGLHANHTESRQQIEELNNQLDDKQKEIRKLRDTIAFLRQ